MMTTVRTRTKFDTHQLRADLRTARLDATIALLVTLVVFGWLYYRVADGTSPTIAVMPDLADPGRYWMYWMCQAFGWTGLLWAWITVVLGLLRSSRSPRWLPVPQHSIEKWHRATSLTTIGLMFVHAAWLFAEFVRDYSATAGTAESVWRAFVDTFVPSAYTSGTGKVAIFIGLLALYLAIPLGLAFYSRRWLRPAIWRALHASIIVVYALSVWHTLLYGTNVWYDGWFRTLVWLLQFPIAALVLYRLTNLPPSRQRTRATIVLRSVAALIVLGFIAIVCAAVVSGHDGGRTPGVAGMGLNVTKANIWWGLVIFLVAVVLSVVRARQIRKATATGRVVP
ncbi:hypothetical protein ACFWPH_29550 [Nocardia sp. NPDC058499]|uniref:hypothetical protein n=1 Tax=Nocardia sp. NPDC058499 TaxID=3346530 RepID=UPI003659E620